MTDIVVCMGKACSEAYQAQSICDRLENEAKAFETCGCMGVCQKAPNVKIKDEILHKQTPITVMSNLKI